MLSLIVAADLNMGIGYTGQLPWCIPGDLKHFRNTTWGHTVVMGRKTWDSLPENKKPLPGRRNIVLSHSLAPEDIHHIDSRILSWCTSLTDVHHIVDDIIAQGKSCFIIGGASLYSEFIDKATSVYLTLVNKRYKDTEIDTYFKGLTNSFVLSEASEELTEESTNISYRYLVYKRSKEVLDIFLDKTPTSEQTYLNCARRILAEGDVRQDRTGTGIIGIFGHHMRFNLQDGFPLLTTKFVPFKSVIRELLWFINGQTDSTLLSCHGVRIWEGNTSRDFLDKRGLYSYPEGDIGPMYGWQWRHFGATYVNCMTDYTSQGIDQFRQVINDLRESPYSRRISMTTYNVADLEKGVLHPCHGIFVQFYVSYDRNDSTRKYLSCQMTQRSMDTFLGAPFNIASYAALTHLLAVICDMTPKELIICSGDTHIYNDHIEVLTTQITRNPYPLPMLKVSDRVKNIKLEEITIDDFDLIGYIHHPRLIGKMSV
jgi:dihydrofolate reductase/thymidylate synthase